MAKKSKKTSASQRTFNVIKMVCANCGEEVFYVLSCNHCGEQLVFSESLNLTQAEIKRMISEDDADFKGNLEQLNVSDDGDIDDDISGVSSDIGTLGEDELDDLYSKGPFSPL